MTSTLELLGVFLAITGIVWISTEGVGLALKLPKMKVAMVAGPLITVLAHGADLLPGLAKNVWGWVFALVFGFVCTLGAQQLNTWVMNPLKKKFKKDV